MSKPLDAPEPRTITFPPPRLDEKRCRWAGCATISIAVLLFLFVLGNLNGWLYCEWLQATPSGRIQPKREYLQLRSAIHGRLAILNLAGGILVLRLFFSHVRKGRRLQFRLKSLLLAFVCFALIFGWLFPPMGRALQLWPEVQRQNSKRSAP